MTEAPSSEERATTAAAKPRKLRSTVAASVGATFLIFGADRLLQILFLALLGRLLSPADFGVLAAVFVFIAFLQIFVDLGVAPTLTQMLDLDERTIRVGNGVVLMMAVLLFALAEAAAPLIAAWFRQPELLLPIRVAALALLIQTLIIVPQALMLRQMRARDVSAIELASGIFGSLVVAVPMALLGFSYWSLVVGTLAQLLVRGILLNLALKFPRAPAFHRAEAKRLLFTSTGFSLAVLFNKLAQESDNLIVGRYLSAHALGLYSRAYVLMVMPAKIYQVVVDRVLFPAMAQVQNAPNRLRAGFFEGTALTATGAIPLTLIVVAAAPELIAVLLGSQWGGAVVPFQILALSTHFRLGYKVSAAVLRSTGRSFRFAFFQIIYALQVIATCMLAYPYGLPGIAAAVSAAVLVNWTVTTVSAARIVGVGAADLLRAHLPGLIGGVIVGAASAIVAHLGRGAEWSAFPILAATLACGALAWLAAVVLAPKALLGPAARSALRSIPLFRESRLARP